jgi:hypothetical protein
MRKRTQKDLKGAVVVCAWCSRYLGIMRGVAGVSHGICLDCKTRELARWGISNPSAGSHNTYQSASLSTEARMGEGSGYRLRLSRVQR